MNKTFLVIFSLLLFISSNVFSRIVESTGNGDWTQNSTWSSNQVPIANDTVIILQTDIVTLSSTINQNSDYLFIVIRGTFDLSGGGKLRLDGTSMLIIEDGGQILGDNNADQISIGGGPSEYNGSDGVISGPSYVADGTNPPISGGGLPPSYIPLPVELLFFTATPDINEILLQWSTASELNNDFFTLERSRNGQDFEIITTVEGNGTSHIQIEYEYTDSNPYLGLSYYRLSQTDYDGTTEIFPAINVLFDGNSRLNIFPNPAQGASLKIQSSGYQSNERLHVSIFNLQGIKLANYLLQADVFGNLDTHLNMNHNWESGTYILELLSTNSREIIKINKE